MKNEKLKYIKQLKLQDETEKAIFIVCSELDELPHSALVRIAHTIDLDEWPEELPGKPDGWEKMSREQKEKWAGAIYRHIEMKVGSKAILRYFHTTELGKADTEFEDWWDSKVYDAIKGGK